MDSSNNNIRRTILFATVPKRQDLQCIIAYINSAEKHDNSAKSNYHWEILKCRQLIFSVPDIIASPVLGPETQIYIISTKEYYVSGKLALTLQKIKLKGSEPRPLTSAIYEACLRYTITAHIAPLWNQVGNCLVQGRDFLVSKQAMNAVKLEIGLHDDDMFIAIWTVQVRLPQLQLEDFFLTAQEMEEFQAKPNASITQVSLGSQWIHVLPSMKKGRVMTVSKNIPSSCPYPTYKEIKRHWKNLYGYRLPETDEGLIYYSVFFSPLGQTLYTYPSLCVRPQTLMFLRRADHLEILTNFLQDMVKKIKHICGEKFEIDPKMTYAVPDLCRLSEVLMQDKPNICEKQNIKENNEEKTFIQTSLRGSEQHHTSQDTFATLTSESDKCSQVLSLMTQTSVTQDIQTGCPIDQPKGRHFTDNKHAINSQPSKLVPLSSHMSSKNSTHTTLQPTAKRLTHSIQIDASQSVDDGCYINQEFTKEGIVLSPTDSQKGILTSTKQMLGNHFTTNLQKKSSQGYKTKSVLINCMNGYASTATLTSKYNQPLSLSATEKLATYSEPCNTLLQVDTLDSEFSNQQSKLKYHTSNSTKRRLKPLPMTVQSKDIQARTEHPNSKENMGNDLHSVPDEQNFPMHASGFQKSSKAAVQGSQILRVGNKQGYKFYGACPQEQQLNKPCFDNLMQHNDKMPSSKKLLNVQEHNTLTDGVPKTKKPRSQSRVQSTTDVEAMAKACNLDKVNAATLIKWLHEQSVPCKVKERKADLINKVMVHLHLQ